jgi:membrane-associated protein
VEILGALLDFVLHVDVHLRQFVEQYGAWVYALLFLIVFVETGVVVMPFLPGDSLLFIVGALAGAGLMSYPIAVPLVIAAAVLGNQTNYTIGSYIGPRVFQWEHSKFFNKRAFDRAHAFYEEYGGITLVAARFLPFLRTFAPFVAGVAQMTRAKFTMYDVTGGTLWVVSIVTAGYLFGNLPWVQTHMSTIIWAMIIVPGMLAGLGAWRTRHGKRGVPSAAELARQPVQPPADR